MSGVPHVPTPVVKGGGEPPSGEHFERPRAIEHLVKTVPLIGWEATAITSGMSCLEHFH